MPALANEPWRGLAKVQIVDNVTGNGRYATVSITDVDPVATTGDQADWDYQNDTIALTLRAEWGGGGAGAPGAIEEIRVQTYAGGGGGVLTGSTWTFVPAGDSGVQTRTFHFDADPLNQVLAAEADRRWGTLELFVRIIRNAAVSYDVDSRGAGAPPAGTTHSWARGYLRQRCFINSHALSNVSQGGAEPASWAAPDPFHLRAVALRDSYGISTLQLALFRTGTSTEERRGSGNFGSGISNGWQASLTATDGGLTSRTSETMFAGSEGKDYRLQLSTSDWGGDNQFVFATSGHQTGWSFVDERTVRNTNRITLDPRWNTSHHFQVDDNVFALASNVTPRAMRADQSGFLWTRITNARGEGSTVSGMSVTTTLDPEKPGTTLSQASTLTTLDGQAGWTGTPLEWVVSKPSGNWDKVADITAPSDQDADTHQQNSAEQDYALQVQNPNLRVAAMAGDFTRSGTVWFPGRPLVVGGALIDVLNDVPLAVTESKEAMVIRPSATGSPEYLDSNHDWQAWIVSGSPVAAHQFALAESPAGSRQYVYSIPGADTADWGTTDVLLIVRLVKDGFPYSVMTSIEVVNDSNPQDAYALDALGLALSGVISQK